MNKARQMLEAFKLTEPVFKLFSRDNGAFFSIDPLARGVDLDESDNDAVYHLKENFLYHERFDPSLGKYTVDYDLVESQFLNGINYFVRNFYLDNAPLKKPELSNTYKWLLNTHVTNNSDLADGFFLLYKYISTFASRGGSLHDSSNTNVQEHVSNALTIIEMLRKKYEK